MRLRFAKMYPYVPLRGCNKYKKKISSNNKDSSITIMRQLTMVVSISMTRSFVMLAAL